MPPSLTGTKRSAGQAVTHALVVQPRHESPSTVMWAREATRNSTVPMRSSKLTGAHSSAAGDGAGAEGAALVDARSRAADTSAFTRPARRAGAPPVDAAAALIRTSSRSSRGRG